MSGNGQSNYNNNSANQFNNSLAQGQQSKYAEPGKVETISVLSQDLDFSKYKKQVIADI